MICKTGDWVKHKAYGIGLVTEDSGRFANVRFVSEGSRKILVDWLERTDPPSPDFRFPEAPRSTVKAGNIAPKKRAHSFQHLLESFLRAYPLAFADPKFVADERRYKVEAAELLHRDLAEKEIAGLLETGGFEEVARRANARASRKLNLVFPNELIKLNDGLKNPTAQERFSRALFPLLYERVAVQQAFEHFVTVLGEMGCPKWTIATIYQFLSTRGEQMFMKPIVSKLVADSLNISLNYDPYPNWLTYTKLQDLALRVRAQLKESGLTPQDGIDVQSFMYVAWHETQ